MMYCELFQGWNWKYTTKYWTSGVQKSGSDLVSCSTNKLVENIAWAKDQPKILNATGNCIQMDISKDNSTAELSVRPCGGLAPLACQVRKCQSDMIHDCFYIFFEGPPNTTTTLLSTSLSQHNL
jgi:hypothetical protein